jgi:CheY-like chemotaxis protein
VHPLIRNVVEMLTADAQAASLRVEVELGARRDVVNGDSARLHQVVWNLLKNAIKFTPENGRVSLRTRDDEAGGRLVIEVEDTGIGIDAATLPTIFDAFEQGGQLMARRYGGLGLGLAIAKRVVALHEGRIEAHSEGLGRGSRFVVELPVSAARPEAARRAVAPAESRNNANRAQGGPLRILLVEDHADTQKLLRRLLEISGHEVVVAGNVTEAVRASELAGRLDLVISDIGLPDGTGLDVMRRVKLTHPGLAGIALTGFGMEQDVRNSELAGFMAHLTKPIDVRRLREMVGEVAVRKGE